MSQPQPNRPYVLVVCSANVCRSPMAERLLQHGIAREPEPLRSVQVLSAGVGAVDGERASSNSIEALRKVGLRLDDHSSRRLTSDLLDGALAVYVMTRSHLRMLDIVAGPVRRPVHLFREFIGAGADPEIPDPFGQNLAAYEATRDAIVEAVPSVLRHLRTLLPPA